MMTATNGNDAARGAATDEIGGAYPRRVAADSVGGAVHARSAFADMMTGLLHEDGFRLTRECLHLAKSDRRRHAPANESIIEEIPGADPDDERMMWFTLDPSDEAAGPCYCYDDDRW